MEAYSYAKNAKKINDNFTKENAIDKNNTMNILPNDKMTWKQMEAKKYAKNADIFECKKCNFKCSKKSDWLRHMNTRKHNMEADGSKKNATAYNCNYCNKLYCSRGSLWKHHKKCNENPEIKTKIIHEVIETESKNANNSHIVHTMIELIKQNQEFKTLLIEQQEENHSLQKQLIDAVKDSGNIYNNTTTNNNQKFNLNFFLNTTCIDAMNMSEFIENMDVQFEDIENIGRDGYVTGMTNMILSRIKNLEVTKRPMHCTDLKRETIYIKDNNVWEKDNDNTKFHNMIQCIAHKNYAILPAWREKNPDCLISDSSKFDFCIKMMTNLLGDAGEGQIKLDNKVIRNITKHINVDKNTILAKS